MDSQGTDMNAIFKGFSDELVKIAARRGLKEVRKLMQAGNLTKAHEIAKATKNTPTGSYSALKARGAGSQIKDLGMGGEGLASLVANPQHGVHVRKLYNPNGISGPEMIARKEQAGKALGNNPAFAKFHGSSQTPHGGVAHHMEYVQGNTPTAKDYAAVKQTKSQVAKGMRSAGFAGAQDIRPANMLKTPQGQVKAIDYLPTQRGEFESGTTRAKAKVAPNMMTPTDSGMHLFNFNGKPGVTPGQLKAQMFRGAQPSMGASAKPLAPTGALPPTSPMKGQGAPVLAPTVPSKRPLT